MRYVKSDAAGLDVYLSSPALASVPSSYHKILKPVKSNSVPTGSWSRNHTTIPKERREKL
jgi:hypothetical protein